ncbi:S-adenosylmethionine--tRNA ribosyltransferase-isomerase [Desulfocicer vacuolatum DSM 3385]|uniref:S-adenosylmethionine:tRNA ribosyltransferase-isomerase n=1 Tax=Desulfocicer vacuolatum DSM 3385 TaxID=1121400 RepID=A0A1W2C374_9BACT|nr:tRNA preQ1(34) S-adenosylmethionine ribosyltransferase-isomerase QueA [Desulfocicer vacuolatum]SMC79551.1 S-adenosylmethionine--tRNA ribosyltransferase-isomerase [Desulfocicer vacuolatum DSM 3385]
MYLISDYTYHLPQEQIAQQPMDHRGASKLLHLNRSTGEMSHYSFDHLLSILRPDDLLVINDTRVIPARLKGVKETGGKVEVLIIDYNAGMDCLEENGYFQCECMIRASKSPRRGTRLFLGAGITARVEGADAGLFMVRFFCDTDFRTALDAAGEIPLPPYILRNDTTDHDRDRKNYQTVYAAREGAVAAPTAGLHFTRELMEGLEKKGVEFAKITLHVGHGTFAPVRVEDIRDHQIHSEFFSITRETARRINRAKDENRRIIAVGTTSVRTLEFSAKETGQVTPGSGMCDLYIYPGYQFRVVDAMVTNFHLPESTLLMLVSAFAGRETILKAYREAVEQKYRFFSYGDAMLLE